MSESVDGIVINVNAYGATIRLDNGEIASASSADVEAHRAQYQRSLLQRRELPFELRRGGRRPVVVLAPQITDAELDEQIAAFLRTTSEWDEADGMPSAQRHFLQKKRRAAVFQARPPAR